MSNLTRLIEKFVADIEAEVRGQVTSEVRSAVEAALGDNGARGRGRGRAAAPRGRGGKRSPEQIEAAAAKLLSYISKNPDQRAEQISRALNLSTSDMVTPLKKLLADKKVKAKGKARGTTYAAT